MAQSTTIEGFPVPLPTNTGWRPVPSDSNVRPVELGDFAAMSNGVVFYKGCRVGEDSTYTSTAHATAAAQVSAEAAAAIAAMDP
jgi:hypothetical protein